MRTSPSDHHVARLRTALDAFADLAPRLEAWGEDLAQRLLDGSRLLVAGNGGSAAEAQHLTAELVGRYRWERRPLSALALHADTSSVTALVNDYGADKVFSRQVEAHGRPGDVLLLLSTSGSSRNVLEAADTGRTTGLTVWALTGPAPNPLAARADDAICVPAPTVATVQEIHLVAVHVLAAAVEETVAVREGRESAAAAALRGGPDA